MPKKSSVVPPAVAIAVNPQAILTGDQVATHLQISPKTVYELTRRRCKNPLPFVRVGKYLRFRWSDIERWLDDGKAVA